MPGKKTIYIEVADDLRSKIEKNSFPEGRLPSERDLANGYGINRLTIRKALQLLFEDGLIAKLGQRGTFITNSDSFARNMQYRKVALIMTGVDVHNAYFGNMITSIKRVLSQYSTGTVIYLANDLSDLDELKRLSSIKRDFSGIIVMGFTVPATMKKIQSLGIPTVLIGLLTTYDEIEQKVDQVAEDHFYEGYECIQLLISKGYRRIAFADGPSFQWGMLSQSAYMRALQENGIPYRKELVFRTVDYDLKNTVKLAKKIMSTLPEAVYARNDSIARGIVEGLYEKGVKIPKDIAIVAAGHPGDSISHWKLPKFESDPTQLGKRAAALLVRRISLPTAEFERILMKSKPANTMDIPKKN